MRPGRSRRRWRPDRVHTVAVGSSWKRRGEAGLWMVISLFRFEAGSAGDMLAVAIYPSRGTPGAVRHMSEARFLRLFVPRGIPVKTNGAR